MFMENEKNLNDVLKTFLNAILTSRTLVFTSGQIWDGNRDLLLLGLLLDFLGLD